MNHSNTNLNLGVNGLNVISIKDAKVGISTTVPTGKLNVGYTTDAAPIVYAQGSEGLVINATRHDGSNYRGYVDFLAGRGSDATNGGASMRFFTQPRSSAAPIQALTLQYDGNVGIGTTTPGHPLVVVTPTGDKGISLTNSSNVELIHMRQEAGDSGAIALKDGGNVKVWLTSRPSSNSYFNVSGANLGVGNCFAGSKIKYSGVRDRRKYIIF